MADYEDGFAAGKLGARQEDHDRRLASMEAKLDAQGEKIDKLVESMAIARGGYRALLGVGMISASVAAGATEIVRWLSHR